MRIEIIGYSGAGKSTLAEILAKHYNLPHLYMDTTHFYGNMQSRSIKDQEMIVKKFLMEHENWVIDGNYYAVAKERFELADEIYFLDYSRWFCLKEAIKRYLKNHKKYRQSLGSVEKFDLSFYMWILKDGRTKYYRNLHLDNLNKAKIKHHFKSRKELTRYLKMNNII